MKRVSLLTYCLWVALLLLSSVVFCEVSAFVGILMFIPLTGFPFQRLDSSLLYFLISYGALFLLGAVFVFVLGRWILFVPAKVIISPEVNLLKGALRWLTGGSLI